MSAASLIKPTRSQGRMKVVRNLSMEISKMRTCLRYLLRNFKRNWQKSFRLRTHLKRKLNLRSSRRKTWKDSSFQKKKMVRFEFGNDTSD